MKFKSSRRICIFLGILIVFALLMNSVLAQSQSQPPLIAQRDWRLNQQNALNLTRQFQNCNCFRRLANRIEVELKSGEKTMIAAEQLLNKKPLNRRVAGPVVEDLSTRIKILEILTEDIRNKRQECMTAFENFDKKSSQLFNILSTLIRNSKELQMAIARNIN